MTSVRLREVRDALLGGRGSELTADELVDAGEEAYLRQMDDITFMVGYELGRRGWTPTAGQSARLRIRDRT